MAGHAADGNARGQWLRLVDGREQGRCQLAALVGARQVDEDLLVDDGACGLVEEQAAAPLRRGWIQQRLLHTVKRRVVEQLADGAGLVGQAQAAHQNDADKGVGLQSNRAH